MTLARRSWSGVGSAHSTVELLDARVSHWTRALSLSPVRSLARSPLRGEPRQSAIRAGPSRRSQDPADDGANPDHGGRVSDCGTAARQHRRPQELHAVSEGTRRTYRSVFDNQIRPVLGDKPIGRIRREDIRNLLLDTMPRTVGPAAVRTARTVLVAMLGEAERSGRIASNPAARIRLPATESQRASFTMATREQLETLTRSLPHEWALAVWLMRGCGLRVSPEFGHWAAQRRSAAC